MFKIKSATRLSITVGISCATIIWFALGIGLVPDPEKLEAKYRIDLTKMVAVNVATFAETKRTANLSSVLDRIVAVEKSVTSIGVRRRGRSNYFLVSGPHKKNWIQDQSNDPGSQVEVEILAGGRAWGSLEIAYHPMHSSGLSALVEFPNGMIWFISAAMILVTWSVLGNTFKYLNPSAVVPDRVRSAFDTLAEGLVLIEPNGEIAHSNEAFNEIVTSSNEDVLGVSLCEFGWTLGEDSVEDNFPWERCQTEGVRVCGEVIDLKLPNSPPRKFVVNSTPISGAGGQVRGVLASFDDVTALEHKNTELAKMIQTLRSSRDEVERQNEQLNFLASYDPLTKCMNRRVFFSQFEKLWETTKGQELSIMMLDVDHFKAVNDNHGHSVGDEVLKAMGKLLQESIGQQGLICRYGGEEFVVLVPAFEFDDCLELAELIRTTIESSEVSGISFTASIGVSSRKFGAMDPQHMLDQADESLYIAKRNGRNQVVRFDERANYPESGDDAPKSEHEIPYSAVTGLLSALAFRSKATAQHSVRVANLCVAVGENMMDKRELYQLEMAALLHDIGKIGVPDAILNKPGKLNEQEWKVMRQHDQIGIEIVRSALASEEIAKVVEYRHSYYSAQCETSNAAAEWDDVPIASRIIAVCDAFDSMTHNSVYRDAISEFEALEELVRNSPKQFDPEVVTQLVMLVQSNHQVDEYPVEMLPAPRNAVAVGQHIENLYSAIADQDVERLKVVLGELKGDSEEVHVVADAANRLEFAINSNEAGIESVLTLAEEVVEICRSTRAVFVTPTEVDSNFPTKANGPVRDSR